MGSYPQSLKPGESGNITFSIKTQKLHAAFQKTVTITSNDPTTKNLRLKLKGKIKQYVEMRPFNANFGKVTGEEPQERIISLMNNTDKPLELTLDKLKDSSAFEVTLEETSPGKEFKLHVKTKPPYKAGSLKEKLTIKTNVEKQPSLTVSVSAIIPKRLDLSPTAVQVFQARGPAKSDKGLTRIIRFTNYGKKPVNILEVSSNDPENIKLTLNEQTPGKAYSIKVELPKGYDPTDKGKVITLKTDDAESPTLTIPVRKPAQRKPRNTPRPAEQMVGKAAPSFTLASTTGGKAINSAELKGSVTVLDFFAPNCGFCKKQLPRVEKLRAEYEAKGVRFVYVSQTMRGKTYSDDDVKGILDGIGIKGEVAFDPGNAVGPLFKANSYPTMAILGKKGTIEAVNLGNIGDLEKRLRGQLDAMLAGKTVPKFASKAKPAPRRRPALDLKGKPAPTFATLATLKGKSISSDDFAKNKAVVLNFVAPNCGFCKRQVPMVESIREAYEAKGVRFVNVTQTMRKVYTNDEVKGVFSGIGSHLELAPDAGNKVGKMFKAISFPTLFVVDGSGKVDNVYVGAKKNLKETLIADLDRIISGKKAAPTKEKGAATTKAPAGKKVTTLTPMTVKPATK